MGPGMTTAICQDCLDAWASEWPAGDVSVRGFDEATGKPLWQCHTCFELERLGIQTVRRRDPRTTRAQGRQRYDPENHCDGRQPGFHNHHTE